MRSCSKRADEVQPVFIASPTLLPPLPLQVVSNCEQHLTSRYTRRLITMQVIDGSKGRQVPCSGHTRLATGVLAAAAAAAAAANARLLMTALHWNPTCLPQKVRRYDAAEVQAFYEARGPPK